MTSNEFYYCQLSCCKELGTNVGTAKHFQLAKQSHVATWAFWGTSWCISTNSGPRPDSQHKYGKKIALGTYTDLNISLQMKSWARPPCNSPDLWKQLLMSCNRHLLVGTVHDRKQTTCTKWPASRQPKFSCMCMCAECTCSWISVIQVMAMLQNCVSAILHHK
jgi:hypothetical protein